jgi:sialic acid synthase SpsE
VTVLDWGHHVVVIGEVGQAHDGSLGTAHAFIDAIADAGADAVKFQTLYGAKTRCIAFDQVFTDSTRQLVGTR